MILNNFELDGYTKIVNKPDLVMFESNENVFGSKIEVIVRSCKKSRFPSFEISCRIGFIYIGHDKYGFDGLSYDNIGHHELIFNELTEVIRIMASSMGSTVFWIGDNIDEDS